jgi:hypothetical protein
MFCSVDTLFPPSTQGVPVLPGRLSFAAYQLVPLLTTLIALYCCVSDHEVRPSTVWDEVVAIVRVEELELAFFIQYSRPDMPAAVGRVRVVADVPVKTRKLSLAPAVVFPENVVTGEENDPLTSSVEFGLVVPIPICEFANRTDNRSTEINSFFIVWIFKILDFLSLRKYIYSCRNTDFTLFIQS